MIQKSNIKNCLLAFAVLIPVLILCISSGSVNIPFKETVNILLNRLTGLSFMSGLNESSELIITNVRLPRVLLASVVGGGLAMAGAVMQAIFKNPMAEPGVLGWSSGGALFAVAFIYLGFDKTGFLFLPFAAFTGTLLTAFFVYRVSLYRGYVENSTLLLSGIAVGLMLTAVIALLLSISSVWSMREMLFWLMGGLDSRTWSHFYIAFFPIFISAIAILFFSKDLNLMLLGDETAKTSGIDPQKTLIFLIVLCSVIVGASVSVSGVIGFVGLVIPHIVRNLAGVDHRRLLPLSFIAGAIFLPVADLFARTVLKPEELRLGVVTSLIGVPFFIYLLRSSILKYGRF